MMLSWAGTEHCVKMSSTPHHTARVTSVYVSQLREASYKQIYKDMCRGLPAYVALLWELSNEYGESDLVLPAVLVLLSVQHDV